MPYSPRTIFNGLLWCCCLTSIAAAQSVRDKVTLLDPKTGSRTRLRCTVLDHTGEYIRYKIREDGPVTVKPSSQVISIETAQTLPHIEALKAYSAGNTKEAISAFEKALKQESRSWVRRDILAMLIRCALRQGNRAQAGDRFLLIYASDNSTHHFKSIPLLWTTKPPSPELKTAAINWMKKSNPAAQLLAGSALLFDPEYQSSAKLDLQQLRVHADQRVRNLAITQLWRLELPDGKVAGATLDSWNDRIQAMPQDLRGGPYFLLGQGRRLQQEYDLAAVSLLWVPFVYDQDYQLSALACLNAADSLKSIGQEDEAAVLYGEVARRYGQSTYSQDAAQALKALRGNAGGDETPSESTLDP